MNIEELDKQIIGIRALVQAAFIKLVANDLPAGHTEETYRVEIDKAVAKVKELKDMRRYLVVDLGVYDPVHVVYAPAPTPKKVPKPKKIVEPKQLRFNIPSDALIAKRVETRKLRKKYGKRPGPTTMRIWEMHKDGKSVGEIARTLGVHYVFVWRVLNKS